jgi:CBS domain-containing protein
MKRREPISAIMTTHVHTVQETDSLSQAVNIIRKNHIRHLPVMRGERVVGILSSTDINRLTFGALFENQDGADEAILEMLQIPQVMSSNPKTVSPADPIRDVAELFTVEDFHAVPVVEEGILKGIVSTTDILRYMLEQY